MPDRYSVHVLQLQGGMQWEERYDYRDKDLAIKAMLALATQYPVGNGYEVCVYDHEQGEQIIGSTLTEKDGELVPCTWHW